MDRTTARQIIKETFQNPFDKDSFVYFVKNLLNYIEEAPFIYRGNFIPDAFDSYIKTLERIGKYQDPEDKQIDVLIVRLKKESSLEHARTMQRNFIAWYLNGSRGGKLKDAALVAFVAPNGKDWRFSLVEMEYKLAKTQTGRVRAKEELTPARRYSFLVGIHESSHTAQSRLVPILEDDVNNPTLKQLEESFNIEKVTKEFFEKYRGLYHWLKEQLDAVVSKNPAIKRDFNEKNISTVDFAKKLLGQIIFLYFLQKKGWFGVKRGEDWGMGSKRFLRELFEKKHGDYKNFFNEILEPLFYEALRLERPGDYYSRFDCRIPFLNGGLFDPINDYDWWNTDILLPNDLFSNEIKTKEGDIGTGILDIFDRYNFTVKEDEPLEKEVAVDPEMLGKVFENLLEVKDRKSKGTYYTPREIVHYMCQESLVNYLATELEDKKVGKKDIETLIKYGETTIEHDTAYIEKKSKKEKTKVYSKAKLPKSIEKNTKLIDEKLATIRVCDPAVGSGAFLVGMMNEVIRARNALTPYFKNKKDRMIYNFKRHAIQNCLYGVDIDPGAVEIAKLRLWLSLIVEEEERATIQPLPNLDYKIVQGNSLLSVEKNLFNQTLFTQLEQLKPLYFNETSASKKQEYKEKINELINKITNGHKDFDFEVYFSEVFHEKKGFDVVIANPPYIRISSISKNEDEVIRSKYKTVFGNYDLYIPFMEKGIDLLNRQGTLSYITPNKYLIKRYANKLRPFILENCQILKLIDTSKARTFDTASVYPVITILTKRVLEKKVYVAILDDNSFEHFFQGVFEGGYFLEQNNFKNNKNNIFDISIRPSSFELFKKILIDTRPLSDYARVLTGTPAIEKFYQWKTLLFSESSLPKNKKILKFINVSNIDRYKIDWGKKIRSSGIKIEKPYIVFDDDLIGNNKWSIFEKKKIVIKGTAKQLTAAFDDVGYANVSLYAVIFNSNHNDKNKNYYHLALLNSKLINFWYCKKFASANLAGNYISFNGVYLEQIPIKNTTDIRQKTFADIVGKILAITKTKDYLESSPKQAKVKEYEKKIDQMVYKLYGLTPEEIKIVEGN